MPDPSPPQSDIAHKHRCDSENIFWDPDPAWAKVSDADPTVYGICVTVHLKL